MVETERHATSDAWRASDGWRVECACGWTAQPQPTKREAEDEAADHVVAVTRWAK
jgi:hypothetical protein